MANDKTTMPAGESTPEFRASVERIIKKVRLSRPQKRRLKEIKEAAHRAALEVFRKENQNGY